MGDGGSALAAPSAGAPLPHLSLSSGDDTDDTAAAVIGAAATTRPEEDEVDALRVAVPASIHEVIKLTLGGPFSYFCCKSRRRSRWVALWAMSFSLLGFTFAFLVHGIRARRVELGKATPTGWQILGWTAMALQAVSGIVFAECTYAMATAAQCAAADTCAELSGDLLASTAGSADLSLELGSTQFLNGLFLKKISPDTARLLQNQVVRSVFQGLMFGATLAVAAIGQYLTHRDASGSPMVWVPSLVAAIAIVPVTAMSMGWILFFTAPSTVCCDRIAYSAQRVRRMQASRTVDFDEIMGFVYEAVSSQAPPMQHNSISRDTPERLLVFLA